MLRGDWWHLISYPHCNHLACGLKSFIPCFIYTCEGLLEEPIIKISEKFCECMQWGKKWGNIWRPSHSRTSLMPPFVVMYFNVWINRNITLGSYSWVLVSSSLLILIKPVDLSMSLVSPFLKLIHICKAGNMFLSEEAVKKNLCEPIHPS